MTWVLVDSSYLTHRALFTAAADLSIEDMSTGIIFSFLTQLKAICDDPRVHSNKVVCFFDSKHSYRKEVFPDYKRRRNDRNEELQKKFQEMYKQQGVLRRDLLPRIGIQTKQQKGLEADDLIAMAAQGIKGSRKKAVIITSDSDLFQCITDAVHWFDPMRKVYYDKNRFVEERGVNPPVWVDVKAIAGDSSDGIPGMSRVGEKRAKEYITGEMGTRSPLIRARIGENWDQVVRNKKLIQLPHPKTKKFKLREPSYSPEEFFSICEELEMVSFLTKEARRSWENFFSRTRNEVRRRGGIP